ncbi:MAG: ComEC/Rec2 family competence protein, partial [Candidatus Dormibacteraceae bacterium]
MPSDLVAGRASGEDPGDRRRAAFEELLEGLRTLKGLPCLGAFAAGVGSATVLAPGVATVGVGAVVGAGMAASAALAIRPAIVALAILFALLGVARAEVPAPHATAQARAVQLAGLPVTLTAAVRSEPVPTATGFRMLVDPTSIVATAHLRAGTSLRPAGLVEVEVVKGDQPEQGDTIRASGTLEVPHDSPGFAWRQYLAAQGAFLQVTAGSVTVEAPAQGLAAWLALPARLQKVYAAAIERVLPQPAASILIAIVLGNRSGVPPRVEQNLISTGLVHLLVLSGLKVALFARLVVALLRPLLRRAAIWPALCLIALYCAVGGATPAALRACGMGALALLAIHLGRQTHVWTSLALLAAAMLAWNPALILDAGFQLSFVGTAAIILFTPALERRLERIPAVLREPFAVTIAAQIGTAPLLASGFGLLSPVSPLANAVMLPILPVAIGGGLLLAPLSLLPPVGHLLALPLAAIVQFLTQSASLLARLPGAAVSTSGAGSSTGAAYYLALAGALTATHTAGRRRRAAIAVAILGPLAITGVEVGLWSHPGPSATVLAVGNGQAVLLRGPSGLVLIDGGPQPATLQADLGQHLAPWERHLTALVIIGGGSGHVGGLEHLPLSVGAVYAPAGGAWEPPVATAAGEGARLSTLHA